MKRTGFSELSKKLRVSKSRGLEAVLKADLISAVLKALDDQQLN